MYPERGYVIIALIQREWFGGCISLYVKLFQFRLLLWAECLKEHTEKGFVRTIRDSCSIYSANMDGSSISLVMNGFSSLYCFVLDRQHVRMYMRFMGYELIVFDILEGRRPVPVPAFSTSAFVGDKKLLYVSGDVFIWLVGRRHVSQVILDDETNIIGEIRVLYELSTDDVNVQVLPVEVGSSQHQPRLNPCVTKNCSHVCALSGPEGASCLCGRNEDLSLDQVTCTGTESYTYSVTI